MPKKHVVDDAALVRNLTKFSHAKSGYEAIEAGNPISMITTEASQEVAVIGKPFGVMAWIV